MNVYHHQVPNSLGINAQKMTTTAKRPAARVRFQLAIDRDDSSYWISSKHNNSDFDYWLVIHLLCLADYPDIHDYDYHIQIMVIAPGEVPESVRDEYISSLGCNDDEYDHADTDARTMAILLAESGCGPTVWSKSGNNRKKLYREAIQEAQAIEMLLGFYLDKPINRIGTTGWEMLRGDFLAGMKNH